MLRTIVVLVAALFIISIPILAQPHMSVEERVQHLKKDLSLTADQVEQVKAIFKEADVEIESKNSNDTRDFKEMRTIIEQTDNKILDVLNDNQKKLYKKMIEERKNRMHGPMHNPD